MKRTTTFLLAAAASLASTGAFAALVRDITVDLSGSSDFSVLPGQERIIQQDFGSTYTGRWLTQGVVTGADMRYTSSYVGSTGSLIPADEMGIIRVRGKGELEYQGWQNELNDISPGSNGGFYSGRVFHAGRSPTYLFDPGSAANTAAYSGFTGTLILEDSVTLRVSGYLNQWYYPSLASTQSVNFTGFYGEVMGVQRVVLNDYARLSFQNSPSNITQSDFDDIDTGPFDVKYRYNLIKNVESVGNRTELTTGLDDNYRVILHMDAYSFGASSYEGEGGAVYDGSIDPVTGKVNEGSIGYLRGKGWFAKSGSGNFNFKNDGDFSGTVVLAGGVTKLSSEGGMAIGHADTVNLSNTGAGRNMDPTYDKVNPGRTLASVSPFSMLWSLYDQTSFTIPTSSAQVAGDPNFSPRDVSFNEFDNVLAIETNQTIHNFQTYWHMNRKADEMFTVLPGSELGSVGTAADSAIFLSSSNPNDPQNPIDHKLTVYQSLNRDGKYAGAIVGGPGAVFEKRGEGKIALFSDWLPTYFTGTIDIQEGGITANGQSLGSGWVNIGNRGQLILVQNNSGTLLAQLRAQSQGELLVTHRDFLNNDDFTNDEVGSDYELGVLQIYRSQPEFSGKLIIHGGVTVLLSARYNDRFAPNDAFVNANSVTLLKGEMADISGEGRQTILSFANSNQRISNFSGEAKTRLELGRGTVTLRQRDALTFSGSVRGAGSVIVVSSTNFTLAGENTYFGATVVKPTTDVRGDSTRLILGTATGNSIKNTSAVVLYAGAEVLSVATDPAGVVLLDPETQAPTYLPQHFGMLFGEPARYDELGFVTQAAPKIVMGDATITIGMDANYLGFLADELANNSPDPNSPLITGIQAAYFFNTTTPGAKVALSPTPSVAEFNVGTSRYYLDEVLKLMTTQKQALLDTNGRPVIGPDLEVVWDPEKTIEGRGLFNADLLEYAGEIVGSGNLVKIGDQRLIINAVSEEFTGNVDIQDGIMRLNVDSFPNVPDIHVGVVRNRDGSILRVAEAEFMVADPDAELILHSSISGEGAVSKIGPGAMRLLNYEGTGFSSVKEGTLILPVLPGLGEIRLGNWDDTNGRATKGTIAFDLAAATDNVTFSLSIFEYDTAIGATGSVRKIGPGKLTLFGDPNVRPDYKLSYSGSTTVEGGELVFAGKMLVGRTVDWNGDVVNPGTLIANIPLSSSSFNILAGATLTLNVDAEFNDTHNPAPLITGVLSGAGTLRKEGTGTLAIGAEQPTFTGPVSVTAGDLSLKVGYALEKGGVLTISDGARVLLNDNNQIFQNVAGAHGASLILGSANIIFNTAAGTSNLYEGNITGSRGSVITKNGPGTLVLRGDNTGDFLGKVVIGRGGVLDATTGALGDATEVAVRAGATLRLFSDNLVSSDRFDSPINDIGVIEKTGPGTVYLAWDAAFPALALGGQISIAQGGGTLIVDSARNNNDLPLVVIAGGSALQINLQADGLIYGGVEIGGTHYQGQISGEGELIIDGQGQTRSLIMNTMPRYTGVTRVQNKAVLNVSGISELRGGIVSDNSSFVDFGDLPRPFYIVQSVTEDAFAGTFIGNAKLEINGEGVLRYIGGEAAGDHAGDLSSYTGTVSIRGGNLEISIYNRKPLSIGPDSTSTPGTLYIRVREDESTVSYGGGLSGEGGVVKTGEGDLRTSNLPFLTNGSFTTNTLTVAEGRLIVNPDHLFHVTTLETRETGSILWAPATGITETILTENLLKGEVGNVFEKNDSGKLVIQNQPDFKGTVLVRRGTVGGNFRLGGDLHATGSGTIIAPGSSVGEIRVDGAFVLENGATLQIEINGSGVDKVIYGTSALLDGVIEISSIGAGEPSRGETFTFIQKGNANASNVVIGDNAALVFRDSGTVADSNLYFTLSTDASTGAPVILAAQKQLAKVQGYTPHKGLRQNFLPLLDTIATVWVPPGALRKPVQEGNSHQDKLDYLVKTALWERVTAIHDIGSVLNNASAEALPAIVNNLSPLGYGSLVSLPAASAAASVQQLSSRLEQVRYDARLYPLGEYPVQIYAIASGNYADLGGDSVSGPNYDYRTVGGMVGADYRFEDTTVIGVLADYANGTANFKQGGGKARMDSAHATAYFSRILGKNGWVYVDGGVSGGYLDYSVTRHTATGTNKSSPEGWSAGGFFTAGTAFSLLKELHITPSIGLEYNHYEFYSANETGSSSSLHVDGFTHDSLRGKIGTGINWFVFGGGYHDPIWKISLDLAYTHEILDDEDTLSARFAYAGGGKANVRVKTLASDTIQIAPSITWNFDEQTSIFASYRFEWGFDGEQYHGINAGVRFRF